MPQPSGIGDASSQVEIKRAAERAKGRGKTQPDKHQVKPLGNESWQIHEPQLPAGGKNLLKPHAKPKSPLESNVQSCKHPHHCSPSFARGITSGKGHPSAGEQQPHVWDVLAELA